jgi:hypothetical protein
MNQGKEREKRGPTRMKFPSNSYEENEQLIRYFNDAVARLNLIYEAAGAGSQGAKELLRSILWCSFLWNT